MCGIAGVIGKVPDKEGQQRMLATMYRRGPDGSGVFEGRNCILLHTRLAIIDPVGGAQPMEYKLGDKKYVITYNGELYNTEDLRRELIKMGHVLFTHSDTEVLLHGYVQWGKDVLEKLNGIYAFAVWEVHSSKLFAARDRMGVKPFFYSELRDRFIFGSEIKTILAAPDVHAVIDENGARELLLLAPGRTPGSGVFRGVRELEPGCCGVYEDGKFTIERYWKLKDSCFLDSFDIALEKVRWLVTDSIERQMVSDVPIGAFLSGGLDSSLITAICAQNTNGSLPTFSVDYLNNEKYFVPGKFQPETDRDYIEIVRAWFNTEHSKTVLSPEDLMGVLEDSTRARDLPGMADVDFSLLAFCEKIRQKVKVALSGECADEIFGGYPWFRDPEVRDKEGFPWAQNTDIRVSMMEMHGEKGHEFVQDLYLQTIAQSDILPGTSPLERRMKEMVNLNIRWFMQTLLDRKDRMSMYHGLEVRVPFCDHRIAEYLYSVPWEYKDHMGKEKGLLRKAMDGILPEKVLWRKKNPYPKTHDPAYTSLVEDRLKTLLKQKDAALFGLVKRSAVQKLLTEEQPWPWYGQLMRRPQIMAFLLQLDVWLRMYKVSII